MQERWPAIAGNGPNLKDLGPIGDTESQPQNMGQVLFLQISVRHQ